jgi:tetratricopeptide (TPR) repeat protein
MEDVNNRMDYSVEYERLYEVHQTVTFDESDEHRLSRTRNLLIKDLGCLTSAEPENSEAFHLLGLCLYDLPISTDTQRQAEAAFRGALAIDPEHQYANLYLGHVLFDMQRYKEADECFARIDTEFFVNKQRWRVVKNDELRLCCRLQLDTAAVSFPELDALCERYETDPVVEYILPQEIVLCLDELASRDALPSVSLKSYASRVLAMLQVSDNLRVSYLQDSIMRLRRVANS